MPLRTTGVQTTTVVEMISMASSPTSPDPLLVSIKAVDPALYPFYGSVDLAPALTLPAALTPTTVAVGDDLLLRLNLHVGDSLKLGNQTFRIAATVVNEPDRLSGSFTVGPRVLLSRAALQSTGLLAPGNRANERVLFKLPPTASGQPVSDAAVADLKTKLVAALPEAQITDYRESSPAITNGLDAATSLLSLMSLVALVLGAVGVAMAMRAHLQQRLDTIAIMKSLGARSSQIIKIYLLQTLFLGVLGGLIGVAGGMAVQLAFPFFLAKLINVPPEFHFQLRAVFTGLGAGVLITLLFTLPPLLDIRNVRPILILRRAVEDSDDPFIHAALKKISNNIAQILATILILGRPRRHRHDPLRLRPGRQVVFRRPRPRPARSARRIRRTPRRAQVLPQSHPPASPLSSPPRPRQSLSPRQPLRRPSCRAGPRRHADHDRLPRPEGRGQRDEHLRGAQHPQRLPRRHR